MTSLQGPGRQNSQEPYADLIARLEQMRRELGDLTSSVLKSAGIRVSDQVTTVDRTLAVDGALDVSGLLRILASAVVSGEVKSSNYTPGVSGWRMTDTGLEVNDITLRGGIVGNDALANPVTFGSGWDYEEGYGTPAGSWVTVATTSLTIPAGFTEMQFTAVGAANGLNNNGSTTNMYARIARSVGSGSYTSPQGQVALPAGFQGIATTVYLWNEPVTPGEVHLFEFQVWTNLAYAASTYNYARLDVAAQFTR